MYKSVLNEIHSNFTHTFGSLRLLPPPCPFLRDAKSWRQPKLFLSHLCVSLEQWFCSANLLHVRGSAAVRSLFSCITPSIPSYLLLGGPNTFAFVKNLVWPAASSCRSPQTQPADYHLSSAVLKRMLNNVLRYAQHAI